MGNVSRKLFSVLLALAIAVVLTAGSASAGVTGGWFEITYEFGGVMWTDTIFIGLEADGRTAVGTSADNMPMKGGFSSDAIAVQEYGATGTNSWIDSYFLVFDANGNVSWGRHGAMFYYGGKIYGSRTDGESATTEFHDIISAVRVK